jgi:threonine dehydrogenase-like Zn-dependent dehydrogenase
MVMLSLLSMFLMSEVAAEVAAIAVIWGAGLVGVCAMIWLLGRIGK